MGSSARRPHALRRNDTTSGYPARCVFFDTETYRVPVDEDRWEWRNVLKMGWAIFTDRRGQHVERSFTTAEGFWDLVERYAQRRWRMWVFAHNLAYDIAVLEWERIMVQERGWSSRTESGWGMLCVGGPTVIDLRKDGATVRLVDSMNFYGMALRQVGDALGFPKGDFDFDKIGPDMSAENYAEMSRYCLRDAQVVERAMNTWFNLCQAQDLGVCAFSAAGQAFNAYRHRFMDHEIDIHTNATALELERESYVGGLTVNWFRGTVTGPVWELDVASMYPAVMRDEVYPRRLVNVSEERDVEGLDRLIADGWLLVAEVWLDVPDGIEVVPRVGGDRLEYPCGRFRTVLTTPELRDALPYIGRVGRVCVYESAPLFRRWVDEMFGLRQRYLREDNQAYATVVKVGFLNSLYGKFGQFNFEWEPRDGLVDDGTDYRWDETSGELRRVRVIGDRVEVRSGRRIEPQNSFAAIASHVTAYARRRLRGYRTAIGEDSVYYADTDSLYVNDRGLRRGLELGVVRREKELGMLEIENADDPIVEVEFFGLKAFRKTFASGSETWKLKGVRRGADVLEPGIYEMDQIRGMDGMISDRDLNRSLGRRQRKRITCVADPRSEKAYTKGVTGADGWVTPRRLDEW